VAADWHELIIPQCTLRPSIARASLCSTASRHATALISLHSLLFWVYTLPKVDDTLASFWPETGAKNRQQKV